MFTSNVLKVDVRVDVERTVWVVVAVPVEIVVVLVTVAMMKDEWMKIQSRGVLGVFVKKLVGNVFFWKLYSVIPVCEV